MVVSRRGRTFLFHLIFLSLSFSWQTTFQDGGEEVEDGAVYNVTLKKVQIQQAANKGARWLGVSEASTGALWRAAHGLRNCLQGAEFHRNCYNINFLHWLLSLFKKKKKPNQTLSYSARVIWNNTLLVLTLPLFLTCKNNLTSYGHVSDDSWCRNKDLSLWHEKLNI